MIFTSNKLSKSVAVYERTSFNKGFMWKMAPISVLSLLWLGMLIGVSFIATPVKFSAPSLTLPVALDIGRQTFGLFGKVEAVCACLLLVASFFYPRLVIISTTVAIGIIVLVQLLWLLPALDARVEVIIQGEQPPPSMLHRLYIALDFLKVLLLAAMAWFGIRWP